MNGKGTGEGEGRGKIGRGRGREREREWEREREDSPDGREELGVRYALEYGRCVRHLVEVLLLFRGPDSLQSLRSRPEKDGEKGREGGVSSCRAFVFSPRGVAHICHYCWGNSSRR